MKRHLTFILAIVISQNLTAQQYTLNGNAAQITCNEYRLTQAIQTQTGSVWNNIKIDLTQSFDFNFDVILGSNNSPGADGIAFVLQPISTSVGSTGGGLGYDGINPAVGVTIDTYQNGNNNDPTYDHIAIQLNGDLNHNSVNNIAGPVTAINGNDNIEDGAWHSLRIQWDAISKTFSAYVDGSLRVTVIKDFVTDVFGGNPLVYWGFTGGTGGEYNYQGFKTALNPHFNFLPGQKRCFNQPVTFHDSTVSFTTVTKFYWDFGDGSPVDSVNLNPVHTYAAAGIYIVVQRVVGADGCLATNTQTVLIGSKPVPGFTTDDNCIANNILFTDTSHVAYGTINNWYWNLNTASSTSANPVTTYSSGGDKNIKLVVRSQEGCESDTLYKILHIYTRPALDFTFADSVCLNTSVAFSGTVLSASDPVTNWVWNIDGDSVANTQNTAHAFTVPGSHTVFFVATSNGSAGCLGFVLKHIFVVDKPTAYFKVNAICQLSAAAFTDSSYTSDGTSINQWWWSLGSGGLSTAPDPAVTYAIAGQDTIKLVVHNAQGCASDTLSRVIAINEKPKANFGYSTLLCNSLPVYFSDSSIVTGDIINKWSWNYNGTEWSTTQNPDYSFSGGSQTVKLVVKSGIGCVSDTAFKTFFINSSPDVTINFKDACKNTNIDFTAVDNLGTVKTWKWTFGDGGTADTKDAQHRYTANGTYPVKLYALAQNGCPSYPLEKNIVIYGTDAFAGNDTLAAAGQPVQLHAKGGVSYTWSPAALLDDAASPNPVATLTATQLFTVKAFTVQGCETYDDVLVSIYKGPDIYLPNAFTPNGDGVNDVFKGIPVGIKQFNFLKVYNRWGQLVFFTADYRSGWDGKWKGQNADNGVYVVIANGIDFHGNVVDKKSTVLLMR